MAALSTARRLILVTLLLLVKLSVTAGERILGEETEDFDFDGLPGAQHEFKVEVPAAKEECFFQKAARGAKLHVSFEVLRGGDRNVDVTVRNTEWQIINAHYWKNQGVIEFDVGGQDTFAICVDNSFGRFSSKLVYMYIVSFVMADWTAYVQEFQQISTIAQNFTQMLANVEVSLQGMTRSQMQSRFHLIRDWYLIQSNNVYVQNWSIAQCFVIVSTSVLQVFFVRRLFRSTNVTPTSKPRA